jgi:hypothetical protein
MQNWRQDARMSACRTEDRWRWWRQAKLKICDEDRVRMN